MSSDGSSSGEEDFSEEEELYEVDKVVDHRFQGKKIFYKVRWKGYAPNQDTWEPEEHLGEGCDEIITAYFELKENTKNKQAKKKGAAQNAARNEGKETKASKVQSSTPVSTPLKLKKAVDSPNSGQLSPTDVFLSKGEPIKESKSSTNTASSITTLNISTANTSTVKPDPEEDDDTTVLSTCTHQPEYEDIKAKDYEMLTRRYEVRSQEDTTKATTSRRCITVLMSQLCDPSYGDLAATFEQLRECMLQWSSRRTSSSTNVSLITAILTYEEDDILSKKSLYQPDVNKSVPGNWTPLHFAAALHKFGVCDWLLEERCWPDVVTINRETPMTLALKTEKKSVTDADKLLRFINRLMLFGANYLHTDYAGKSLAVIAKRRKCNDVAQNINNRHQGLTKYITSLMETHVASQPGNLQLKEFFIEPQVITQPPGITYMMRFKFKSPGQRCVARLTVAYCDCTAADDMNPIRMTTNGNFPFKMLTLNGHSITPADPKFMCMTLKSELIVGNNVLELEVTDAPRVSKPSDSIILFGFLVAQSELS